MKKIFSAAAIIFSLTLSGCHSIQEAFKGEKRVFPDGIQQVNQKAFTLPLAQILQLHPDLLNDVQQSSIEQVFNHNENPTAAQVTVIQSGLMDDSVAAIRTIYQFKKNENQWFVVKAAKSYQCARHSQTNQFQTVLCL